MTVNFRILDCNFARDSRWLVELLLKIYHPLFTKEDNYEKYAFFSQKVPLLHFLESYNANELE